MTGNLRYQIASTLTPSNFWLLSESNMFTMLVRHCAPEPKIWFEQNWAVRLRKVEDSLFTLCYSEINEEFMARLWGTNWKGGAPQPPTGTTPSVLSLSRSGGPTKCGSWCISASANLLAFEFTDVFSYHLHSQACFPEKKQKYLNCTFVITHLEA